jgi:RNA polymerase sigma-70 factor (ECF subfamily)
MSTGLNDNELIRLVLEGRTDAFSSLVDRHKDYVFTLVLRIVKSREDAEEVAQDVFLKAFRYLADFKGTAKFTTWLYTIASNTSLSFLRKKKPGIVSLDDDKNSSLANRGETPVLAVELKSKQQMIRSAMDLLSAEDARILSLFYQGEQGLDEIAAILGIEQNAAKVRLHRARARLKEKMETHFTEEVRNIY